MKFESTGFPKWNLKKKSRVRLLTGQGMENRLQFSRLKKIAQKYCNKTQIWL